MDEMNGAFEEKKRRKGGKRLMQPEKAAKAAKEPRAEKPPRVPRETSARNREGLFHVKPFPDSLCST
jgi:hypothetical protein